MNSWFTEGSKKIYGKIYKYNDDLKKIAFWYVLDFKQKKIIFDILMLRISISRPAAHSREDRITPFKVNSFSSVRNWVSPKIIIIIIL